MKHLNILAVNNYSLDDAFRRNKKGLQPAHHCWGIDYLRECGHSVHTELFAPQKTAS